MRCELPNFRRCCFCIPLRYGILTFGYLNLVSTILLVTLEMFVGLCLPMTVVVSHYRGLAMLVRWLPRFLHCLEVVLCVILLIGAHTKRPLLIRIYFYYGILTTVTSFLTLVVMRLISGDEQDWYWTTIEFCFAIIGLVLQVYLLLLIRTELQKLKDKQTGLSYENHLDEVDMDPPPFGDIPFADK